MIRPICHCERRKVRGNPLFLFRVLRILSRFALRMTSRLVITTTVKCAINCRPVIAKVRVSGGHLCKTEAPTEPAGETAVRRVAIRFPCSPVIAKPCKRLRQSVLPFYKAITSKNISDLLKRRIIN